MDVSKQEHYEVRNPQPIDVAIAWELDYLEGNVLKYLGRWRFKNGVEDLEKMVDYAQRLLARERTKVINPLDAYRDAPAIQDGEDSSTTLIAQDTNGVRSDEGRSDPQRWMEHEWQARRDRDH